MMLTETTKPSPLSSVSKNEAFGLRLKPFLLLLAGYFLLQAASRGLISETLGMDESEDVLRAQKWSLGYGPQPPLYLWLILIVAKIFGLSSFTLAALKNCLLFGIYVLTYFCAKRITRSHVTAMLATVALQFMPSIAYEAHRELTHSILASFMVMATLFFFLRIADAKSAPAEWINYLLLGIVAGLGMLSKFNFVIFYLALALAAVSLKSLHSQVLNIRATTSIAISLLIVVPILLWIRNNPELALASAGKFDIDPTHSLKSMGRGIRSWFSTSLDQIGLLILAFGLVSWRGMVERRFQPASDTTRLLLRTFLFTGGIVVLGIVISGATNCRNRWLQPLLVPAPVLVTAYFTDYVIGRRIKWLFGLAAAVAIGVALAAPGRILLTETLHKREGLNAPFRSLAGQIKSRTATSPLLYCNDTWIAGNLRIWFPDKTITAPATIKLYPPTAGCSLVWEPSFRNSSIFVSNAAPLTGNSPANVVFVEARWKYHHTEKNMRLGLLTP